MIQFTYTSLFLSLHFGNLISAVFLNRMSPEMVYVHVGAHFLRTGWGLFKMGGLKKKKKSHIENKMGGLFCF